MANILIAEDDIILRDLMAKVLRKRGHKVKTANDGLEALNCMQSNEAGGTLDILISDIIMPAMNGLNLMKQIHETYPHVKIVAVSGGGRVSATNYLEAAKSLANQTLQKPFSIMEFATIVDDLARGQI